MAHFGYVYYITVNMDMCQLKFGKWQILVLSIISQSLAFMQFQTEFVIGLCKVF